MTKYITKDLCVAPFAGAWIEISDLPSYDSDDLSLPSRERGLKYKLLFLYLLFAKVAPFAGAWIEIR